MGWKVEHFETSVGGPGARVVDETGSVICDSEPYYPTALDPKYAHLIAAAPAMLEALKAMVVEFKQLDLPYGSAAYLLATTAIAAAEAKP